MGNVHVANGSSRTIRARASQEKIRVKEIDATGKLSFPFSLEASVKLELEHSLDELSFARIGPGESLEFDLSIISGDEYITVGNVTSSQWYFTAGMHQLIYRFIIN